jgi:hypothetical protein
MKAAAVFLIITCLMLNLNAQKNISGEYYLQGVMETASGFKLNADSTFEFFFSYGALDRYGSGKWSVNNNTVILNSKPSPGKDFKLANSVASNNKFSTIKIEDKNTNLYRFVYCRIKTANKDSIFSFDEGESLRLPYTADSLEFLSELCPERSSVFAIDKSPMIYTFNIQPWILEVFFNQAAFHFTDDYIEGRHPLLDDKIYRFEKEKTPNQ